MSPSVLHGSRKISTNFHKLVRFVNALMAFYILTPFILVLERISSLFSFTFCLLSFIFHLPTIVHSFFVVKKGSRRCAPTPTGSLGTVGHYQFRLLICYHSRSIYQRRYNGNLLHVFYPHRATASGPSTFRPLHVLLPVSSPSRESKSKKATPFVHVPKKTNPYVHLQVKFSDGSMPWIKVKASNGRGGMRELHQEAFDVTRIHIDTLPFVHAGRLLGSLDKFKDRSFVRLPPVLDVSLRLFRGMEKNQDVVDFDQSLWAQGSNMALVLLPESVHEHTDSDELKERSVMENC